MIVKFSLKKLEFNNLNKIKAIKELNFNNFKNRGTKIC